MNTEENSVENKKNGFMINKITLKNYKMYENKQLEFKSNFTILVGENASGKTTILDGVATGIGCFLLGFKNINNRQTHTIKNRDIRTIYKRKEDSNIEVSIKTPVEIIMDVEIDNKKCTIKRKKNDENGQSNFLKKENKDILKEIKKLEEDIDSDDDESKLLLPVFSYHGTGRLWEQDYKKTSKMELLKRLDGYNNSLEAKSNYRNFVTWFEKLARAEFSQRKPNKTLKSVKDTIIYTLEYLNKDKKIENIDYREGDLEIYYENGDVDRIGQMSDGYRNIIGIVSDIAYRICILNLGMENNIKNTSGIVLIDEIDLHLHPLWQKKIVGVLKNVFPNVQFIATTHSPFIIQCMERNEIIRLSEEERKEELSVDGTEMSIEEIAENVMNVETPQRHQREKKMLDMATEKLK